MSKAEKKGLENPVAMSVQVTRDGKEIARISLAREKTFIGRMGQNDIVLEDAAVSRSHALIMNTMGRYFVIDQGSQNGTLLNGRAILQDEWKPGDLLSVGPFLLKLLGADAKEARPAASKISGPGSGETTLSEHDYPSGKSKKV